MRELTTAAPGKAVLIGEYAVLHGTPALVMAVDRRVRVRISACAPGDCLLEVPQLAAEPIVFAIGEGRTLCWPDSLVERPELALCRRLLERALARSAASRVPDPGGLQVLIDSSELFEYCESAPIKLGLGSSAAVSVALWAALESFLGDAGAATGLADLHQMHRASQAGRGSGIDVAASLLGGLLAYRLQGQVPEARSLVWPQDWPLLFVWTGQAAATGGFLERYESWRRQEPEAWAQLYADLDQSASSAIRALEVASLPGFMTCINNYCGLMGRIGDCINVPVVSSPHQRLAEMAVSFGAAYKPCGAGGGDLGVFVASDGEALAQLGSRVRAGGFRALALKPSLTGLQLTLTENTTGRACAAQ